MGVFTIDGRGRFVGSPHAKLAGASGRLTSAFGQDSKLAYSPGFMADDPFSVRHEVRSLSLAQAPPTYPSTLHPSDLRSSLSRLFLLLAVFARDNDLITSRGMRMRVRPSQNANPADDAAVDVR